VPHLTWQGLPYGCDGQGRGVPGEYLLGQVRRDVVSLTLCLIGYARYLSPQSRCDDAGPSLVGKFRIQGVAFLYSKSIPGRRACRCRRCDTARNMAREAHLETQALTRDPSRQRQCDCIRPCLTGRVKYAASMYLRNLCHVVILRALTCLCATQQDGGGCWGFCVGDRFGH